MNQTHLYQEIRNANKTKIQNVALCKTCQESSEIEIYTHPPEYSKQRTFYMYKYSGDFCPGNSKKYDDMYVQTEKWVEGKMKTYTKNKNEQIKLLRTVINMFLNNCTSM